VLFIISFRKLTALPDTCVGCSFSVISFRWWSDFPRRHGSCLLAQANMSRLGYCLVRIALKLIRFRKPTFIRLKSGAGCTHKPVCLAITSTQSTCQTIHTPRGLSRVISSSKWRSRSASDLGVCMHEMHKVPKRSDEHLISSYDIDSWLRR